VFSFAINDSRDESFLFTRFPESKITFLEIGSGSNWWFKINYLAKTCFIPTQVVSDCPKNAQNPNSTPTLPGAYGSLRSPISFPAFQGGFQRPLLCLQ